MLYFKVMSKCNCHYDLLLMANWYQFYDEFYEANQMGNKTHNKIASEKKTTCLRKLWFCEHEQNKVVPHNIVVKFLYKMRIFWVYLKNNTKDILFNLI